jgi:hypothetical protein
MGADDETDTTFDFGACWRNASVTVTDRVKDCPLPWVFRY